MNRSSYGERDYAFGLTQAGLAELLHVSRRTVAEWEAGLAYPKADHLKRLITLGMQQQAFAAGREAEEIRALWRAAHQKVLLDELWLAGLLSQQDPPPLFATPQTIEIEQTIAHDKAQSAGGPRVDWGDVLAVPTFYGRKPEMALLTEWVVQERCRVVSVLGLGGIGKSALAVSLMHRVASHFEEVLWRSLRDAPACEALLDDCLQVLSPQPLREVSTSLEQRLGLLLGYLREERVLLVLDNLEVLLEEGEGTGHMRAGYEDYGWLLRRVAETAHGRGSAELAQPRFRHHRPLWLSLESRWQPTRHCELSARGSGVGSDYRDSPVGGSRAANQDPACGMESGWSAPAEWRQRWKHTLVEHAERRVRGGAKGTSRCGSIAQCESQCEDAGQLRG